MMAMPLRETFESPWADFQTLCEEKFLLVRMVLIDKGLRGACFVILRFILISPSNRLQHRNIYRFITDCPLGGKLTQ